MGAVGQSSDWRILNMSSLSVFHVPGREVCRNHDRRAFTLLTAQNYCNFSKLPTFYLLICIVFIPKTYFTPRSWPVSISWSCLFASLGMVITRFWWWKFPLSCRLSLVSSVLFCPLLPYSLSSVSLREFFGVAHLITVAGQATSSYRNILLLFFLVTAKLERAQFTHGLSKALLYVVLIVLVVFLTQQAISKQRKHPWHSIFRMNHFFHFSCDRFLIVCPWFFFSTCVFVKKISSNRGEALILMYHFRSQFCGLKTGKWGLRDLFYPIFFGFYRLSYRLCCRI